MKRTFKKSLIFLSLITVSLTACKKDKDKSRTDLLTEKEWKYVDYGSDDNNDGKLSADENYLETCEMDDTYILD